MPHDPSTVYEKQPSQPPNWAEECAYRRGFTHGVSATLDAMKHFSWNEIAAWLDFMMTHWRGKRDVPWDHPACSGVFLKKANKADRE